MSLAEEILCQRLGRESAAIARELVEFHPV